MSLFDLFKKKDKEQSTECNCACSCGCGEEAKPEPIKTQCSCNSVCNIKVLGSGCRNCHTLYENTQTAVKNMGINADVEYITDMEKVMSYGAMSMPVLVLNEKIISMGKVLKLVEIENLLHKNGL